MAEMRRCIGSTKFGIEAHEAPVGDFPKQPSQKDGLGRMCKRHWNQYTSALRRAALERKAADATTGAEIEPRGVEPSADDYRGLRIEGVEPPAGPDPDVVPPETDAATPTKRGRKPRVTKGEPAPAVEEA